MDSVIEATNMNLTQLWEAVEDRRSWHAWSMGSRRVGHNLTTKQQQQLLHRVTFNEDVISKIRSASEGYSFVFLILRILVLLRFYIQASVTNKHYPLGTHTTFSWGEVPGFKAPDELSEHCYAFLFLSTERQILRRATEQAVEEEENLLLFYVVL